MHDVVCICQGQRCANGSWQQRNCSKRYCHRYGLTSCGHPACTWDDTTLPLLEKGRTATRTARL